MIQVASVELEGQKQESIALESDLKNYATQFVMENGQVDSVCSHPSEPVWVTNMKKGVISSFQSSQMPSTDGAFEQVEVTNFAFQ